MLRAFAYLAPVLLLLALSATSAQTTQPSDAAVEKLIAPTLISLDMKDAAAKAVIDEIRKQTLYDIAPMDNRFWDTAKLGPVSVTANKQPFWAVMRDVCGQGGLWIYNTGAPGGKMTIMGGGRGGYNIMKFPVFMHGAFMTMLTMLSHTSTADLANPPTVTHNLMVMLQVCVEPKIKVLSSSYMADMDEAVDENGKSLLRPADPAAAANAARTTYGPMRVGYPGPIGFSLPLIYPDGAGKKIASLRGKVRVTIEAANDSLQVPDVLKARDLTKTVAGRKITLKDITKLNDREYRATIVFYRGEMTADQFRDVVNNHGMRLINEEGQGFTSNPWGGGGVWNFGGPGAVGGPVGGGGAGGGRVNTNQQRGGPIMVNPGQGGGQIIVNPGPGNPWGGPNPAQNLGDEYEAKVSFRFQAQARDAAPISEPTTLIWDITTATKEIAVPFEFKDLPLP